MASDADGIAAAVQSVTIGTFVRLKPTANEDLIDIEHADYLFNNNEAGKRTVLHVQVPDSADQGLLLNHISGKLSFEYDKVFEVDATNQLVFNDVVNDKVLDAFNGISSTVFAYGQTGSGKSYTMMGGSTFNERGIIPLTIERIFDEIKIRQTEGSYTIQCQMTYTEIFKEVIYDLLDFSKANHGNNVESTSPVQILEDENGNMLLNNVNVYDVASEEDALKLFFLGNNNRITGSTAMNSMSSRSHAILTLVLSSQMINNNNQTICINSKINLVDLAGSERMYKMHNSASQINEAKSINLSLHYLEQVVVSLRDRAKSRAKASHHIPYRNSVLTSLLRDSLGGNSKASFVVTLSIEKSNFEETISSLRFGQRCGEIKVEIVSDTKLSAQDQIYLLEDKVKSLQHQLARAEEKLNAIHSNSPGSTVVHTPVTASVSVTTSSKVITAEEKLLCKRHVDELIAAVKTAMEQEVQGVRVLPNGDELLDRLSVRASEVTIFDAQQDFCKKCESMEEHELLETATILYKRLVAATVESERTNRLAFTSCDIVDTNTHNENYVNFKPNLMRSSSSSNGSLKVLTRSTSANQAILQRQNSDSPSSLQRSNSSGSSGLLQRQNSGNPGLLQRSNSSGSPGSLQRQNSGSPGSLQRQNSNRNRVKRTLDQFHVSSDDIRMLLSGAIFIKYGRLGNSLSHSLSQSVTHSLTHSLFFFFR